MGRTCAGRDETMALLSVRATPTKKCQQRLLESRPGTRSGRICGLSHARAQGSTGIIGPHRVTGDSRSDPHLGRSRSLPDILRLVIAALVMGMGRELSTAESAQLPGLLCGRVISALEALEPDADADRVRRTIASQVALLAVGLRFGREAMHAIDDDSMSTV
jgi:hypothetical protein